MAETAFVWFLRLMAVFAMIAGLSYWAQLTGLGSDASLRFDQLPIHWKVTGVVLAVLLPCASMGLWMLTSWGIVLWTVASLIEIGMYSVWASTFQYRPAVVLSHVATLAVLLAFVIVIAVQRHRARVNNY